MVATAAGASHDACENCNSSAAGGGRAQTFLVFSGVIRNLKTVRQGKNIPVHMTSSGWNWRGVRHVVHRC